MSTSTNGTAAPDVKVDERAQLVAGIRALADLVEQNPDLPAPRVLTYQGINGSGPQLLSAAAYLREHDIDFEIVEQSYGAGQVEVRVDLGGGVRYDVDAKREDVCTPRIENGKVVWNLPPELAPAANEPVAKAA